MWVLCVCVGGVWVVCVHVVLCVVLVKLGTLSLALLLSLLPLLFPFRFLFLFAPSLTLALVLSLFLLSSLLATKHYGKNR